MSHPSDLTSTPSAGYPSERLDAARLFDDLPLASSPAAAEVAVTHLLPARPRPRSVEPRAAAPTVKIRRVPPAEPRLVVMAIVGALAFLGAAAACSQWHAGAQVSAELHTRVQSQ